MDQIELIEFEKKCTREQPPACAAACPIHVDVRTLNLELSQGNLDVVRNLLRNTVPFPGIISRICDQPCREVCKRGEAGSPISIRNLERACLEWSAEVEEKITVLSAGNKRVAIIGGGLGGLTVAFDMAKKGYDVVIFEMGRQLGGRIWRLPERVLPEKLIAKDIEVLKTLGVNIRLTVNIGKDVSFSELLRDYDAIYMTVGRNTELPVEFTLDEMGRVRVDAVTFETSVKGVFSRSGRRREGREHSPIEAIADGRRAAISMDCYLQCEPLPAVQTGEHSYRSDPGIGLEELEALSAIPMYDHQRGYSVEEAICEAARCFQCNRS